MNVCTQFELLNPEKLELSAEEWSLRLKLMIHVFSAVIMTTVFLFAGQIQLTFMHPWFLLPLWIMFFHLVTILRSPHLHIKCTKSKLSDLQTFVHTHLLLQCFALNVTMIQWIIQNEMNNYIALWHTVLMPWNFSRATGIYTYIDVYSVMWQSLQMIITQFADFLYVFSSAPLAVISLPRVYLYYITASIFLLILSLFCWDFSLYHQVYSWDQLFYF